MCQNGDIILIERYMFHGQLMRRHSFIVINNDGGRICGLNYDLINI